MLSNILIFLIVGVWDSLRSQSKQQNKISHYVVSKCLVSRSHLVLVSF